MHRRVRDILAFVFLSVMGLYADRAVCDQLSLRPDASLSVLKGPCLEAEKTSEQKGDISRASWYALLSGDLRYSREVLAQKMQGPNWANIAHAFVLSGDLEQAKRAYQTSIDYANLDELRRSLDEDYRLLALLYPDKKKEREAGKALVSTLLKKGYENQKMVDRDNPRLTQRIIAGDNKGLIALLNKLIPRYRKEIGPMTYSVATLYTNLGAAYGNIGDNQRALEARIQAMEIGRKIYTDGMFDMGRLANELAVSYEIVGNVPKALKYYAQALKIFQGEEAKSQWGIVKGQGSRDGAIANIHSMMANCYLRLGKKHEALVHTQKALKLSKAIGDTLSQSIAYESIARLYGERKQYDKTVTYLKKALKIREKFSDTDPLALLQTVQELTHAYAMLTQYKRALPYAERAIKTIQKMDNNGTLYAQALNGSVPAYLGVGQFKKAYENALKAFDIFMDDRNNNFRLLGTVDKEYYTRNMRTYIVYLLEALQAYKGNTHDRLAVLNRWLRYKGSVFDSENRFSIAYRHTQDPDLKAKMKELSEMKRQVAQLYLSHDDALNKRKKKIQILNARIRKLTETLSTKVDVLKILKHDQSITAEDVAQSLRPDEIYVDYAKVEENYMVFLILPDKRYGMFFLDKHAASKINRDIRKVKSALDDFDKPSRRRLAELYRLLIKEPLGMKKEFRSKSSLVISQDGLLSLIPFEMLYNQKKKRYLIEERKIRYIPSAKGLLRLKAAQKQSSGEDVVIFAHPDFNIPIGVTPQTESNGTRGIKLRIAFTPLPGTLKETKYITELMKKNPIHPYLDRKATTDNLLAIHGPKILHLSTHGYFDSGTIPANPMLRSHIALAGANYAYTTGKGEGIVSALTLSGLDLQGTDLVVVSACQTGVMDAKSTDSISGLSKAFIEAGAKDVVTTLWSVSDRGSAVLTKYFYTGIAKGKTYANALRDAKLRLIKEGAPIAIWAPFVMNGL